MSVPIREKGVQSKPPGEGIKKVKIPPLSAIALVLSRNQPLPTAAELQQCQRSYGGEGGLSYCRQDPRDQPVIRGSIAFDLSIKG